MNYYNIPSRFILLFSILLTFIVACGDNDDPSPDEPDEGIVNFITGDSILEEGDTLLITIGLSESITSGSGINVDLRSDDLFFGEDYVTSPGANNLTVILNSDPGILTYNLELVRLENSDSGELQLILMSAGPNLQIGDASIISISFP